MLSLPTNQNYEGAAVLITMCPMEAPMAFSLRVCAWHRRFVGYIKLLGLVRSQRWAVTHGVCRGCQRRIYEEWSI